MENITIECLCHQQVITTVNGTLSGLTINAREGDIVVVHIFNKSPYNLTIHWYTFSPPSHINNEIILNHIESMWYDKNYYKKHNTVLS